MLLEVKQSLALGFNSAYLKPVMLSSMLLEIGFKPARSCERLSICQSHRPAPATDQSFRRVCIGYDRLCDVAGLFNQGGVG